MEQGMQVEPDTLIAVQSNLIAQAAVKAAQYEAAIMQLQQENNRLHAEVERVDIEGEAANRRNT